MNDVDQLKPTRFASLITLFASGGTLICCALPALLVAVGAGAALSTLIAIVPQIVWFSEHKAAVFLSAATMLIVTGILQWRSRRLPCPADPALARACIELRRNSWWIYAISLVIFLIGAFFAFIAPLLM